MALCRRISYLYALALLTIYALFLPLGGYERMMEGKYRAFLLLSLGYVLAMTALGAWKVASGDEVDLLLRRVEVLLYHVVPSSCLISSVGVYSSSCSS